MTTSNLSYLCPGCFAEKGATSHCTQCGYDEQAPRGTLLLAHRTVLDQQFLIGRVLGKPGGFGITYLAWDLRLETRVAVKEYLPRDLAGREANHTTVAAHTGDDVELFRYGLEQFVQEARTLAQLNHPNIVRARQFFEANGTAYLVMDYYDGLSLAEYLDQQGGKLPEQAAVQLMLPVLDGLRAVHEKGFLHRDIKPQNIYLAKTDTGGTRPILLDFGAARQAMGERSRSLSVLVSAGYAPFEQYQRKGKQGPWSDIYSAAAVLYRSVTGIEPLEANERIPDDNLRPAATLGVPQALSDALQGALAFSPSERPATVQAFQAQLLGDAQPQPTRPAEPTAPESATESPKSLNNRSGLGVLIGLAMLIAVLAGAGGAWVLLAPETLSDIIGAAMSGRSNATAVSEGEGDAQQAELARERAADEARESKLREERAAKAEEQRLERQREQHAAEQAKRLALATCREHMENRRYTYPEDDNALLCYRGVLKTDPDNAEAKEAFTFMTGFYVDSAKQALMSGDRERVQDRIARMRRINPDSEEAETLARQLAAPLAAESWPLDSTKRKYYPPSAEEIKKFEACATQVYENLENKGIREYGDRFAYIGASGRAALGAVKDACGSKPMGHSARGPALSPDECNRLYTNVFLSCYGDEKFLDSGLAESYFLSHDESIVDRARFAMLCSSANRVSREDFGILLCGE